MNSNWKELILEPWSDYSEAKTRSRVIDQELGYEIEEIETEIKKLKNLASQTWSHLSEQIFQTPYPELAEMIRSFETGKALKWVDLGTAYGRLGLVLHLLRPDDEFVGIELLSERVSHAQQVLEKATGVSFDLRAQDILDPAFIWPEADVYFIFDFSESPDIAKALTKLQEVGKRRPISVIGRGRATRFLIAKEHPWLGEVEAPWHTSHWSLYRNSTRSARIVC